MKAITITTIFFIMLLAGIQTEVHAQASATVNFTIVVTEDMLAGGENAEPRGFGFNRHSNNESFDAASNVSFSLLACNDAGMVNEFSSFEAEVNTSDSPAVAHLLQSQFTENSDVKQSENTISDEGQYIVVMEYN